MERILISETVVHAHPIVVLRVFKWGEEYVIEIYNKEFNKLESSFFLTENVALDIIQIMTSFLKQKFYE